MYQIIELEMESTKKLIKRARWMEPAGQLLVLLGFGLQIFYLDPAKAKVFQAEVDYLRSIISDIDYKVTHVMDYGSRKLTDDEMRKYLAEKIADAVNISDDTKMSRSDKSRLTLWFASLFIIGSFLVVIGKSASIKASS